MSAKEVGSVSYSLSDCLTCNFAGLCHSSFVPPLVPLVFTCLPSGNNGGTKGRGRLHLQSEGFPQVQTGGTNGATAHTGVFLKENLKKVQHGLLDICVRDSSRENRTFGQKRKEMPSRCSLFVFLFEKDSPTSSIVYRSLESAKLVLGCCSNIA